MAPLPSPTPAQPPALDVPALSTFARDDLVRAVQEALAASAWLLTAGELQVARAFLALPAQPGSLYARLHGRRGVVFRLDGLSYAEVPDLEAAVAQLVAAGFADRAEQRLPTRMLAEQLTVPELKAACASLGLRRGGRRAELLERLADEPARAAVERPALLLRHQGLFQRLARLFLGSSDGDLSRLVMERIEVASWPTYEPSGGGGLFPDRRSLRRWEQGLAVDALLWSLEGAERRQALLALLDEDLALVESSPAPPAWRRRYSGRRRAVRRASEALRELERAGRSQEAVQGWRRLLDAGIHRPGFAAKRLALALEAAGQAEQGAAVCQQWLDRASPEAAWALARTGRRLARKARQGWAPLPPLQPPRQRRLQLQPADTEGRRPRWQSPEGPKLLEPALVTSLAALGRTALHAENQLWRTLFGLLFADLLFMPVPGMLPTPFRTRPLDLGTDDFVAQRAPQVDALLARIRQGEAEALLVGAWEQRQGQAIVGVRWKLYPLELLRRIAAELPGPALAEVMELLARDWGGATRGLPDLLVLSGPALHLPGARPARLPEGPLLAEVKGPGDQLRDAQRLWLHRLARAGLAVELWRVEAASDGPVLAPGPGG